MDTTFITRIEGESYEQYVERAKAADYEPIDPSSWEAEAAQPATPSEPETPAEPVAETSAPASVPPSPEIPPTTGDQVAADHPALGADQSAPLAEVPDSVQSEIDDGPVADVPGQAHGWDAGDSGLQTGWFKANALDEVWTKAQADEHGVQDGIITAPAHLRDMYASALVHVHNVIGEFDAEDEFSVTLDVSENNGNVMTELCIGRRPASN